MLLTVRLSGCTFLSHCQISASYCLLTIHLLSQAVDSRGAVPESYCLPPCLYSLYRPIESSLNKKCAGLQAMGGWKHVAEGGRRTLGRAGEYYICISLCSWIENSNPMVICLLVKSNLYHLVAKTDRTVSSPICLLHIYSFIGVLC